MGHLELESDWLTSSRIRTASYGWVESPEILEITTENRDIVRWAVWDDGEIYKNVEIKWQNVDNVMEKLNLYRKQ